MPKVIRLVSGTTEMQTHNATSIKQAAWTRGAGEGGRCSPSLQMLTGRPDSVHRSVSTQNPVPDS